MLGVDVSENNNYVDWPAIQAAGVQFAFVRAGYGQGNEDSKFREYVQAAHDIGLQVGAYWFSYALDADMGRKEGEYCRQIIDDWGGQLELPVYHDQESDPWRDAHGLDYSSLTDQTLAFADALGLNSGIYSYYSWVVEGKIDIERLQAAGLPFWLAQYNSTADLPCDIWQYTSSGQIGQTYPLDLNVMGE